MKKVNVKEFKLVLVNEADYSKACNGNNGNYDHYEVYADRFLLTEISDNNWNRLGRTFIYNDQEYGNSYFIENENVYLESKNGELYVLYDNGEFYEVEDK